MLKFKIESGATDAQIDAVIRCLEALKTKGGTKAAVKVTKAEEEPETPQEEPAAPHVSKRPPTNGAATLDMIREAVAAKKDKHLQAMKAELQNTYKAANVNKLDPADYDKFYYFVQSL